MFTTKKHLEKIIDKKSKQIQRRDEIIEEASRKIKERDDIIDDYINNSRNLHEKNIKLQFEKEKLKLLFTKVNNVLTNKGEGSCTLRYSKIKKLISDYKSEN